MATPTTLPASFVSGAVLTASQMNNLRGAFRVLQVVQTVKTDTFSTTSTSFTDVTGMSVTITPSATSSKILVLLDVKNSGANAWQFKLLRGATDVYVGDLAGSRSQGLFQGTDLGGANIIFMGGVYLDSPATTSATTYKIQMKTEIGTNAHLNRSNTDTNTAALGIRTASSITVMEISA